MRIQKMMKIRDRLFQKFKSTKSTVDLKAFKQFRNRVVNELRESKKNYYHHFFEENKNDMKMLWNGIKNIVSLTLSIPTGPQCPGIFTTPKKLPFETMQSETCWDICVAFY